MREVGEWGGKHRWNASGEHDLTLKCESSRGRTESERVAAFIHCIKYQKSGKICAKGAAEQDGKIGG